jgi:hypothetical protein
MAARPKQFVTALATMEAPMCLPHIDRDVCASLFPWHLYQHTIAGGAPRHGRQELTTNQNAISRHNRPICGNHLSKLRFQNLAMNQQALYPFAPRQLYISRENDPPLCTRYSGNLVIARVAGIARIVAQQAQPLGQTPQHGIRQKSRA